MMASEDSLLGLITEYKRYVQDLEMRQARQGIETPPVMTPFT